MGDRPNWSLLTASFSKFPSLLISAGEDGLIKLIRYKDYLQVGDPWTFPCRSAITDCDKEGCYLLVGHDDGNVRLVLIRLPETNSETGSKSNPSANVSAVYTDTRGRRITSVALRNSTAVVALEGEYCN